MKKKIAMCILICTLMIITTPLAAGVTDPTSTTDIGRVWLRGLIFRRMDLGNINYGWAVRLHYIEFTPTEKTFGVVNFNRVAFSDSVFAGRMFETGLGFFTYVCGFFRGGLEIQ